MHLGSRLRLVGVRACALAAVATGLGVWGHIRAGGMAPDPAQWVMIWAVAALLSAGFLLRRAGWFRIAALLLVEQLLVHTSLMTIAGTSSMAPMPGMSDMPGMAGMSTSTTGMSLAPSPAMLAGHALAAAVAGLWLWRGECALWTLLDLAGASIRALWRSWTIAPLTRIAMPDLRTTLELRTHWGLRVAREIPRRGPPLLATS